MRRRILFLVVAFLACDAWVTYALLFRSSPQKLESAPAPVEEPRQEPIAGGAEGEPALATLSGSVFVAGEGTPVSGTEVRVEGGSIRSVTDSRGRFQMGALDPGDVVVRVEADYPLTPTSSTIRLTGGANEIALALEPRYVLAVRLRDASSNVERRGDPIAGARVVLGAPDLHEPSDEAAERRSSLTDERGECDLADIPEGDHALHVEAPGYLPIVLALSFRHAELHERPHLREREITLQAIERGEVVRGHVLDREGRPIAGALVCLDTRGDRHRAFRREASGLVPAPPHDLTDEMGAFSLEAPARQAALALLVCPNRARLAPVVRQEVRASGMERDQIVRVPPAFPLNLRVSRRDGSPAPGKVEVRDGQVAYDLKSDALLMRVPGFAETFLPKRAPGSMTLDLPEGGYTILFESEMAGLPSKAFFVRVTADGPRDITLHLDV